MKRTGECFLPLSARTSRSQVGTSSRGEKHCHFLLGCESAEELGDLLTKFAWTAAVSTRYEPLVLS
jgi:hypothetical protein